MASRTRPIGYGFTLSERRIIQGIFYAAHIFNETLPAGGVLMMLMRTADAPVHFKSITNIGGDAHFVIGEAPDIITDGTPLTPINCNRVSTNVASTLLFANPTRNDNGLLIEGSFLPGGSTGNAVGSTQDSGTLIVGKPNTDYLLCVENLTALPLIANLAVNFYEDIGVLQ
jgi:hypothetical protein